LLSINNSKIYVILKGMIVSNNNNLLNILLPNDNKVLNEVLKEADSKTLESLNKGSSSVGDILKNLFTDLKTGEKNSSTIEDLLKNSNLFKDLGNFSKDVTSLLDKLDTSMEKFKPALEAFSKDISNLDSNNLKDLMGKSGVFLEAKISQQTNGNQNIPKNLENILTQIKTAVTNNPSLQSKNITNLIDNIIQKDSFTQQITSDLKTLTNSLQEFSKGLNSKELNNLLTLTNTLKEVSSQGQLLESKIENFNQGQLNTNILSNKQEVMGKAADTLLQQTNNNQNLSKDLQNILTQIKTAISADPTLETKNITNLIDNMIQKDSTAQQLTNDLKTLTTSLEELSKSLNTKQFDNLQTLTNTLKQLSSQGQLDPNILSNKQELITTTTDTLLQLKSEIFSNGNIANKQNLLNQIDTLLQSKDIFSQNNFSSKIDELIVNLKQTIVNLSDQPQNLTLQNTISKNIEKLETILQNFQNQPNLMDKQNTQNLLQNDMKSVLLQIQSELQTKTDTDSIELSKQVDKMILQIEYHQLLSIASNSNSVYLPFIWDMLDDGSISMKKLDEDKFYCEINLSLKEFGQTQLLLALYDKNKLDMTVYVSKDSFKQTFRENLINLKRALNSVNLIPVDIKIIDLKENDDKNDKKQDYNPYGNNQDLSVGLDIRV